MELTLLGTGTSIPTENHGPASLWVKFDETSVLVDCGSGSLQKFVQAGGDLSRLDAIVLSHAHLDHVGDLPNWLFALNGPEVARKKPLNLVTSRPLHHWIEAWLSPLGDWVKPRQYRIQSHRIESGESLDISQINLTAFTVSHHPTSLGFRLRSTGGKLLVIPSDTEMCPSLVAGCRGADCLVIECAATDQDPIRGHLSPRDLISVINRGEVGKVVLTHRYLNARTADVTSQLQESLTIPVITGVDGMKLSI